MAFSRRAMLLTSLGVSAGWLPRSALARADSMIVYNGAQLTAALAAAGPGDTISLAPGNYADGDRFAVTDADVTVRALIPLTAVLRVPLLVTGRLATVDGLDLEGVGVTLAGDGVQLVNCRVQGSSTYAIQITAGDGVTVSGCEVCNFRDRGIMVRIGLNSWPTAPVISNNHIHDTIGTGDAAEGIQLGQNMRDNRVQLRALVQGNLLERVQADSEAISVKCSGNTISGNRLLDSRANIVNRHGEGNVYAGNDLERSYGIVIQGRGSQVIGNRCVGSLGGRAMRIMGGDVAWDSMRQGGHPQAYQTLVSGNIADLLVIGALFPGDHLPAIDTTVENHQGPITVKTAIGTTVDGA